MLYVRPCFLLTANEHITIKTEAHLKYLAFRLICFMNDEPYLYFC